LGSFGEKLRRQRERRGIALEAISNTTKISTRMLRALEEEHFDQLPGGVFNKGFVRAYARYVGLDEEEAISDYLEALREGQMLQHAILPEFRAPANGPDTDLAGGHSGHQPPRQVVSRNDSFGSDGRRTAHNHLAEAEPNHQRVVPSPEPVADSSASPRDDSFLELEAGKAAMSAHQPLARIRWGTLVVALLLVVFAVGFWNLLRRRESSAASRETAASQPAPALQAPFSGSAATAPSEASAPAKAHETASAVTPSKAASPDNESSTSTHPAAVPSKPTAVAPVTATATKLSAPTSSRETTPLSLPPATAKRLPAAVDAKAAAPSSTTKPPAPFSLLILADETTWVSIMADGKPVTQETLIAPAHTSVRASKEIVVRAGNAGGIRFELKGRQIPGRGKDGEVKTYVFDASGLRETTPAASPR